MIRDVTGLNEARDGSDPDPHALVGVQKLAAANSNTATRHILHSSLYITSQFAEAISIRIKDVLEYHPQKEALISSIGRFSVGALQELSKLHHHDFGIFLELDPDADEKQLVEQNIQIALSKDQIFLEDAIDIRQIKNIKLANQLLKYRRNKKQAKDQERAERNIAAQSEANGKAAQAAEMAKAQAEQIKVQAKSQLAEAQVGYDIKKLEVEAATKKELMQFEFDLNMKLKEMELDAKRDIAGGKITQKDILKPPSNPEPKKGFESSGNDVLGGIDLSRFDPR
jgi:flagellar biosynthesis GTPase FlhF